LLCSIKVAWSTRKGWAAVRNISVQAREGSVPYTPADTGCSSKIASSYQLLLASACMLEERAKDDVAWALACTLASLYDGT
jgi:hypothetical protein